LFINCNKPLIAAFDVNILVPFTFHCNAIFLTFYRAVAKVQFLKTLWEETFYQEVIQVQINSWTLGGTEKCGKFWLLLYLDMQPKAS